MVQHEPPELAWYVERFSERSVVLALCDGPPFKREGMWWELATYESPHIYDSEPLMDIDAAAFRRMYPHIRLRRGGKPVKVKVTIEVAT